MNNKEVLDKIFGTHSIAEYANHNRQFCHDCILNAYCGANNLLFKGCLSTWEEWLNKEYKGED